MMQTAISTQTSVAAAVADIQRQLPADGALILYFHSASYAADEAAQAIAKAFPGVPSLGCSTAGELCTGRMQDHSFVAASLPKDLIPAVSLSFITEDTVDAGLAELAEAHGGLSALSFDRHLGLFLADGLSGKEESLIQEVGARLDTPVVGGSAGDDLAFKATFVAMNGKVYQGGAVMALLSVPKGFDVIKTQSFEVLGQKLMPTKVCTQTREVLEFNGQPARQAYAAAVGSDTPEDLFMRHPLGLVAGDEPFVRSPQQFIGDTMRFYCGINEGVELSVLKSGDIVQATQEALSAAQLANCPGLLVFNCILRTLELKSKNQCAAYGNLFKNVPTLGFSTYGEAYLGHINQTATMVAFK